MFVTHPEFIVPDMNTVIWRYMSLPKFAAMLADSSLFFCRADRLGDPFEGSFPKMNLDIRDVALAQALDIVGAENEDLAREFLATLSTTRKEFERFIAISCWHMNEHESAAMWALYAKGGVAISSSVGRLIRSLQNSTEEVRIGFVRYRDFERDAIPEGSIFAPFTFKRMSFEHEREVRAIVYRHPIATAPGFEPELPIDRGVSVPVDLAELVQAVHVGPLQPPWFATVVRQIAHAFGLSSQVNQSGLDATPLW
jgi:hypothetical protein